MARPIGVVLLLILVLPGCTRPLLFNNGLLSHTIEPLTFNREPTELTCEKQASGRIHQFQYPLTSALSIRLGKNGLGDVARENGIKTIYYADIEQWSVLFGLWQTEIVHIYGR